MAGLSYEMAVSHWGAHNIGVMIVNQIGLSIKLLAKGLLFYYIL